MRTNYEMTAADLQTLLDAMKPVPMIALQCGTPPSVQENANAAWARLGKKMGFDPMTVQPTGRGDRFFSAVETAKPEKPHIIKDGKAQGPEGRRGTLRALDDVSFEIAPGEILGVVGESGAGKSLTGASIIGLLEPPGRVAKSQEH